MSERSAENDDRCPYFSTDVVTKRGRSRDDGWRCGENVGHSGGHVLYTADGESVLHSASWAESRFAQRHVRTADELLDNLAARIYLADRERPGRSLAFVQQPISVQNRYRGMAIAASDAIRRQEADRG